MDDDFAPPHDSTYLTKRRYTLFCGALRLILRSSIKCLKQNQECWVALLCVLYPKTNKWAMGQKSGLPTSFQKQMTSLHSNGHESRQKPTLLASQMRPDWRESSRLFDQAHIQNLRSIYATSLPIAVRLLRYRDIDDIVILTRNFNVVLCID